MFKKGQSLIEILIVLGMMAIVLPALLTGLVSSREGKAQQLRRTDAVNLMREAITAAKSVRNRDWAAFAVNGTFYPVAGSTWTLTSCGGTCPTDANGYTSQIVISDASRDVSGKIVSTGGTVDPSTKKVVVTVSWTSPRSSSVDSTLYFTRYKSIGRTQTTQTDFNGGARSNTYVVATNGSPIPDDGQVILGAGGGGGDWCIPNKSITDYTLPGGNPVSNALNAVEGNVYIGTGENSSGKSFTDVRLTTNQDPPQVILPARTFDGVKTNSVFGETLNNGASNYAYLTTDSNAQKILDLNQFTDPPTNTLYKQIGTMTFPESSRNGTALYVVNNKAYVTGSLSNGDPRLFIYSLAADRTSSTLNNSSGYSLTGTTAKEIIIGSSGVYAYVVTDATTNNFEIINISNAASPSHVSYKTIGSSQTGVDVSVTSTENIAYVAVSYSSTAGAKNVYKVDISDKSNPVIGLGYNTASMNPTAITYVTGNRAIVVGTGGSYQYQVLNTDTMDLCSPTSQLSYPSGVSGIASVLQASNGYAYSYITTKEANVPKLKIILGGAGGQYVSSGTFISSTINSNSVTAFNGFTATVSQPSYTTIGIKVGVASPINNSCATVTNFDYVGPNGDPATSFTIGSDPTIIQGAIPLLTYGSYYRNPGQCFKYKVTFDTNDPAYSPILYDFTVNYSP